MTWELTSPRRAPDVAQREGMRRTAGTGPQTAFVVAVADERCTASGTRGRDVAP